MKNLLTILFILPAMAFAVPVTYYISPTGNNGNIGTSPASAWQTLQKLRSMWGTIQAGDTVKFEKGGTYYGDIVPTKNSIYFTNYGDTGAKPIISGFTALTGWTNTGGNTWICTPSILPKQRVNLLTKNGLPVEIGRYPNKGSWLKYESFNLGLSITDNELPSSPDWTGADAAVRKEGYVLQSLNITNHTLHTLTTATLPTINPRNAAANSSTPQGTGWGYVLYRSAVTLDVQDEWFYDTGGPKVVMYSVASPTNIRISTIDTLFNAGSRTGITIDGLAFEGSDMAAIYNQDGGSLTIKNVAVLNSGARGIMLWNSPNTVITNTTVAWCLGTGIDVEGRYINGCAITNCTVTNIANFDTQGNRFDNADMNGIYEDVASNVTITNNVVRNIGYNGIQFHADNVLVQYNLVDTVCYIKDDGGCYYTAPQRVNTNSRLVDHNFGLHAIGAPNGKSSNETHAEIFYHDQGSRGVTWSNNTGAYGSGSLMYLNDPKNCIVTGNTGYSNGGNIPNNGSGWGGQKHCVDSTFSFAVNNNIIWATNPLQKSFYYYNYGFNGTGTPITANLNAALAAWGVTSNNFYNVASADTAFVTWGENPCGGSNYPKTGRSLAAVQSLGQEAGSVGSTLTSETFYMNPTMAATTITFPGLSKKDIRGNVYNGSATIQPFESLILVPNGSTPTPPAGTGYFWPYYIIQGY